MAILKELNLKKKVINILIVDDHKMLRQGFKNMLGFLKQTFSLKIQEAESGEEAIRKINRLEFDLVFMDYQMPGISGIETIRRVLRFKPLMKFLVLSTYDQLDFVESAMDAGAKGYLLKNVEAPELLKAINVVLQDKNYYSQEIAIKLLDSIENNNTMQLRQRKILTNREMEVLKLIATELTNDEIAKKLFISKKTVNSHRQHLLSKLHAKNTAGLVKAAFRMKMVEE